MVDLLLEQSVGLLLCGAERRLRALALEGDSRDRVLQQCLDLTEVRAWVVLPRSQHLELLEVGFDQALIVRPGTEVLRARWPG